MTLPKKLILLVGLLVLVLANTASVFAEEPTGKKSIPATVVVPAKKETLPSVDVTLTKAKDLFKRGKLEEAQKIYQGLLKRQGLSHKEKARVKKLYGEFNLQRLFSRFEIPEAFFYTVLPGDSLYKIAKDNKTTVELIKRTNGLQKDTIFPETKLKLIKGTFSIRVDKSDNKLNLYLDDQWIKEYSVATGSKNGTPVGAFKIVNKLENPTWYYAGAVLPPESPDNVLGTRWLGFDYQGYGIHGTIEPESIGKQASLGCIRMLNAEVEELYSIVPAGIQVTITN